MFLWPSLKFIFPGIHAFLKIYISNILKGEGSALKTLSPFKVLRRVPATCSVDISYIDGKGEPLILPILA